MADRSPTGQAKDAQGQQKPGCSHRMSPWVSQGGAEALVRGEEGDEVEAEAEVVGTAVRRVGPVAHPGADLEGLAADGEELVDPEVYRDRRLLRGPVIGDRKSTRLNSSN